MGMITLALIRETERRELGDITNYVPENREAFREYLAWLTEPEYEYEGYDE